MFFWHGLYLCKSFVKTFDLLVNFLNARNKAAACYYSKSLIKLILVILFCSPEINRATITVELACNLFFNDCFDIHRYMLQETNIFLSSLFFHQSNRLWSTLGERFFPSRFVIMPLDIVVHWVPSIEAKGSISWILCLQCFLFLLLLKPVFFNFLFELQICTTCCLCYFERNFCSFTVLPVTLSHMKTNQLFIKSNKNFEFIITIIIIL